MNLAIVLLFAAALLVLQSFIGGAKLVYGLPSYLLLGAAGVAAIFARQKGGSGRLSYLALASTIVAAGYVIGRAWMSPVEYIARTDLFMGLAAVLAYLVMACCITSTKDRVILIWILLVFALLHVGVGVLQFRQDNNYMLMPWMTRPDYGDRASGLYICPNHLAGLLEMLAIFGLALMIWGRGRILNKVVLGYLTLVCLAGVALTGSRGGYLSTVAGLAAFVGISIFLVKKLRPQLFGLVTAVSVGGLMAAVAGAMFLISQSVSLQQRLDTVYDPNNMRLLLWKASLQQTALNPVFGTGSATYVYYGRQFRSEFVQNDPIHVHNDYLHMLCEYGAVGLGLTLLFVLIHASAGWSGVRRIVREKLRPAFLSNSNELALAVGGLAALAAIAVHSIVDFNLHIPANTVFVAALLGLLANPGPTDRESSAPPVVPLPFRLTPALAGIALIALAAPLIRAEVLGEKARVALREKRYEESKDLAGQALVLEKKNPDLYYYAGEAEHHLALQCPEPQSRREGHIAVAKMFEEGLAVFPQDLRLLLKLGRTYDALGDFPRAEDLFQRALAADSNFGTVYALYGIHRHSIRDFKTAESMYRKALSLGEKEFAAVGLQDLERDRHLPSLDPFSQFVSSVGEEEEEEEEESMPDDGKDIP